MKKFLGLGTAFGLAAGLIAAPSNIYLDVAKKAANWLMAKAARGSGGEIAWPVAEETSTPTFRMLDGAAGIGTFFLELFRATGHPLYLEYAEGAGRSIASHAYADSEIDWLTGAPGMGCFLIELWKTTRNEFYLNEARRAADFLIAKSREDRGGYSWKHYPDYPNIYTGFAHGASGIGYFFARLYRETGDLDHLKYAKGAAAWVNSYRWEAAPGLYCWPRLTADTTANTSWCGGSVGIIIFFWELYDATGEASFRECAEGGTAWLVSQAEDGGGGSLKWSKVPGTPDYCDAYCHGNPSVAHILFEAYGRTKEAGYLETARRGAKWDRLNAQPIGDHGLRWTHYSYLDTGLLLGPAGVGNAMALFYEYDPDPDHLAYARGAAYFLISVGEFPALDQVKWLNYLGRYIADYGPQWHEAGWYSGVAGIGLFFLNLGRIHPPPRPQNQPPVLAPLEPQKIKVREKCEFAISAADPEGDPVIVLAARLPPGASFKQGVFSWTPQANEFGKYAVRILATDGYAGTWQDVEIEVLKTKSSVIRK